MKCLYCGEPLALALLKRFTGGGEFCSDTCKSNYQVEFTQLAVGRLQQARVGRRPGSVISASPEETAGYSPVTAVLDAPPPPPPPAPVTPKPVVEPPPPPMQAIVRQATPASFKSAEWFGVVPVAAGGPLGALALAEPWFAAAIPPAPFEYQPPPEPEPEPDVPAGGFVGYGLRALSQLFERAVPVRPAPVTVYLQFPIDPRQSRLARPVLAPGGRVESHGLVPCIPGRELYGRVAALLDGFHDKLAAGPQLAARRVRFPRAFPAVDGFSWVDGSGAPGLLATASLVFAPRGLGFAALSTAELVVSDARYDQFLRPASRETLLDRIRHMRRGQPLAENVPDSAPVTLEQVQPALDLLKSIGESLAAQPGALALVPAGAALAAGGEPGPAAADANGEAALIPWNSRSQPPAAPLPAPIIDPNFGRATAPVAAPGAAPAGPGIPPGLIGPNSQAFLFGTEIALAGASAGEPAPDENLPVPVASPVTDALPAEPLPAAAPAGGPTFNQVSGFGPPAGGSMNIGTMVVVNQPAGAITINAGPSQTAATFEARLKPKKEPGPLSSIAEAVGLQIPARTAAEALPLRMNFAGSLASSTPIHWPVLSTAVMRRKFFFGAPPKQMFKRPEPPPVALRPAPARSAAPAPPPLPAEESKGGWLKSLSGRFGLK